MKKTAKLCVAVLAVSALTSVVAYAATPGSYVGLGLGVGKQETSNLNLSNPYGITFNQSRGTDGLAGRLFAGYNLNNYFGVEAGLAQYSSAKTQFNTTNLSPSLNGSVTYRMTALDLIGKAYLPFTESGFNLYALGGVALVHSKVESRASISGFSSKGSKIQNTFRPVVGAGASYDIPQTQLTTSLEYSHTTGKGNVKTSTSAVPAADLLTLNLAYNLG